GALGIVDPHGDDHGPAGACDLLRFADHTFDLAVVVHRQIGAICCERHALDVELADGGAGFAAVGNGLRVPDLRKFAVVEDVIDHAQTIGGCGQDLHAGHHEGAVADDRLHRAIWK